MERTKNGVRSEEIGILLRRSLISQNGTACAWQPRVILGAGQRGPALEGMLLDATMSRGKPVDLVVSVIVHLVLIAAALAAPMLFAGQMVLARNVTALATPPLLVAGAPALRSARTSVPKPLFRTPKLAVPVAVPRLAPSEPDIPQAAPVLSAGVTGISGGLPSGVLGGILADEGHIAPPPPANSVGMLRVGGQVQRPQLIYNPEPEYPSKARKAKIEGDVEIDAIVDRDGNVVQAHAVSGPSQLIDAAVKAVSQWKYEPTYLNGSPYPLELIVDVNFRLG